MAKHPSPNTSNSTGNINMTTTTPRVSPQTRLWVKVPEVVCMTVHRNVALAHKDKIEYLQIHIETI